MSAFTDFIQLELPKRPYLETDLALESIFIRRGNGARQMAGIKLNEGEVLSMVEGTLQGVDASGLLGGLDTHKVVVLPGDAAAQWEVLGEAGKDLRDHGVIVQCRDDQGYKINPDEIQILETKVVITWPVAISGTAAVIVFGGQG